MFVYNDITHELLEKLYLMAGHIAYLITGLGPVVTMEAQAVISLALICVNYSLGPLSRNQSIY